MNFTAPVELLSLQETPEDKVITFDPSCFDEYLGQHTIKEKLKVYVQAAKMREEPLDHLLLFGATRVGQDDVGQGHG